MDDPQFGHVPMLSEIPNGAFSSPGFVVPRGVNDAVADAETLTLLMPHMLAKNVLIGKLAEPSLRAVTRTAFGSVFVVVNVFVTPFHWPIRISESKSVIEVPAA